MTNRIVIPSSSNRAAPVRKRFFESPVRKRFLLGGATVIVSLLLSGACNRATEQSPETKVAPAGKSISSAPASPIDTVRACHALRNSGQLRQAAEMVVPERRDAVLDLLLSVDRLTIANRELERAVRERIGAATATVFSRPGVANIIGVFSRDVEVLSERIDSDRAEVTIQVDSRVPLQRVSLVRLGGVWLIETDPPVPGLSEEIQNLAAALADVARSVRNRPWTADELASEIKSRERGILRRISQLIADSDSAQAIARSDGSAAP